MNNTFSERFKSARLLKGYSLQDLADALENKISRQALHRYEKGEVIPDEEMLNHIANALGILPGYFFRKINVEIVKVEFRKLQNLPAKEETKIIEQTREYLSRYLELEEILGVTQQFVNHLSHYKNITSFEEVNNAARDLRKSWNLGLGPISSVVELFEDNRIKVLKLDADLSFDGLQTWVDNSIPVIGYNKNIVNKHDRLRFTLLHELAHLLLGDRFGEISDSQKEILCHQFAGAMLMPEETIKAELGEHRTRLSNQELGHIKKQFGISMQAIVMRAKDCKIINDHYSKQFFFMIMQLCWKVDEPFTYEGNEESKRFEQLLFRAMAEEIISVNRAAELNNQRLADFKRDALL